MCKYTYLSFHLFSVSVSLDILILILDLGEWGVDYKCSLAPTAQYMFAF